MGSRRSIAFFPGEKEMSAGRAARTTVLDFMGEGPPRCWDTVRDNGLEEAQPPETDHESVRWTESGTGDRQGPVRFSKLLLGSGAFRGGYSSSAVIGIGSRAAAQVFGFCLLIHAGLKHERRGCSMPPSQTRWD